MEYVDDIIVTRDSDLDIVFLSQRKYITELLTKAIQLEAQSIPTPMVSSPKLIASGKHFVESCHQYRSIVEDSQYVWLTRLDIACSVNKVSQYVSSHFANNWMAVKRILRYLCGTLDYRVFYKRTKSQLICYADADWAARVEDCRSTSAFCIYLGDNPMAWRSGKTAARVLLMQSLKELHIPTNGKSPGVTTLAVSMAANPTRLHSVSLSVIITYSWCLNVHYAKSCNQMSWLSRIKAYSIFIC